MICILLLFSLPLLNAKFMLNLWVERVGRTGLDNWGPKLTNDEKCPFPFEGFLCPGPGPVIYSGGQHYGLWASLLAQMKLSFGRTGKLKGQSHRPKGLAGIWHKQILSIRPRDHFLLLPNVNVYVNANVMLMRFTQAHTKTKAHTHRMHCSYALLSTEEQSDACKYFIYALGT